MKQCTVCHKMTQDEYQHIITLDICESCYLDKEVKDSEKHLKGYDESKPDYLASVDSEGYQGVWGGGRHGF